MKDLDLAFNIEDFTKEVKGELELAVERILYAWGLKGVEGCVEKATEINPEVGRDTVDTGRYRAGFGFITPQNARMSGTPVTPSEDNPVRPTDSLLSHRSEKNSVIIANNVEYAKFLEAGTVKMPARYIMKNGIESKFNDMKTQAEEILKGEL